MSVTLAWLPLHLPLFPGEQLPVLERRQLKKGNQFLLSGLQTYGNLGAFKIWLSSSSSMRISCLSCGGRQVYGENQFLIQRSTDSWVRYWLRRAWFENTWISLCPNQKCPEGQWYQKYGEWYAYMIIPTIKLTWKENIALALEQLRTIQKCTRYRLGIRWR